MPRGLFKSLKYSILRNFKKIQQGLAKQNVYWVAFGEFSWTTIEGLSEASASPTTTKRHN